LTYFHAIKHLQTRLKTIIELNGWNLKSVCVYISTLFVTCFFVVQTTKAQPDTSGLSTHDSLVPMRIAVLVPLYLDSAFHNYDYKLANLSIPKYFLPGLEFYNGVLTAADSLQKEHDDLDVWVFDTKKKGVSSDSLAKEVAALHCSLIIASLSNTAEQKVFSDLSLRNNIPLISATYPNDAYLSGNPFFIMLNSSLKTHIETIYKYVQVNHPLGKVLYVTKQGALEDKIQSMFSDVSKKTYPLKYKSIEMRDNFTSDQLLPLLDSNRQNVIVCGSVNEAFGANLLEVLNEAPTSYTIVAVGMPTWDGLKAVYTCSNENLDIVYSTPFNYPLTDKTVAELANEYKTKYNGRPSDMFFKGFETMYCFSKLALKYHNDLLNNLSDTSFHISNPYQLRPVNNSSSDASIPDYIENKKLYFIHISQGTITLVN